MTILIFYLSLSISKTEAGVANPKVNSNRKRLLILILKKLTFVFCFSYIQYNIIFRVNLNLFCLLLFVYSI